MVLYLCLKFYFLMSWIIIDMDNVSYVELNDFIENIFFCNLSILEFFCYILVIVSVFYLIIFIVGIILNLLVVVVVVFVKCICFWMSVLFVNLGIVDMMVIFVCMLFVVIDFFVKEVWYFGEFMCKYFRLFVILVKEIKYVKFLIFV